MADEYIKKSDAQKLVLTIVGKLFSEEFDIKQEIQKIPSADVVEIPETGIGDLSDGYHTFNGLYYQRMVLFSALVNAYNGRAWKSWKHEDGEPCFGGGWFIVGIDTPKGSYTYHYEDKYWNWFECEELPVAKHWDGHTEEDVTRLLTLPYVAEVRHGKWIETIEHNGWVDETCAECSECGEDFILGEMDMDDIRNLFLYCPNCGADMRKGGE